MKVLYCSYEVAPFFKKGGLGDVAGSLPKALASLGIDINVMMPGYGEVIAQLNSQTRLPRLPRLPRRPRLPAGQAARQIDFQAGKRESFFVEFDGKAEEVRIWESVLPGSQVPISFLSNQRYLSELKAAKEENIEQFAFFSKVIVEYINQQSTINNQQFNLIHLNDWHTALVPLLLKLSKSNWERPATLLTVHNFSHQGIASLNVLLKLGISKEASEVLAWDISDQDLEILMEGIIHSDIVNTVSPTYAKEVLHSKLWGRLSEVLKGKEARVKGILNGIDYDVWNPDTDRYTNFKFRFSSENEKSSGGSASISNFKEGKKKNKLSLQKELGLKEDEKIPLFGFISRLAGKQKGLDILNKALIRLLPQKKLQFVLLGKGNERWEKKLKKLEKKGYTCVVIRFDEPLAHRIYAGADFLVVPSRFEPCGLIQQMAMRYGTLPIVRKTGGLADTVQDGINGFVFEEYSGEALVECIQRALVLHATCLAGPLRREASRQARYKLHEMIRQAMNENFSWDRSAREYLKLYQKALEIRKES